MSHLASAVIVVVATFGALSLEESSTARGPGFPTSKAGGVAAGLDNAAGC